MVFLILSYFILGLVFCLNQSFVSRWWFFVFMRHFYVDFLILNFIWFFRNGFLNSLIVRFRSSFLFSQLKFFELYVRTCPAMFFTIQRIWIVLGRCLFSVRNFYDFWSQIGVVILVTPKQEMEQKSECFYGVKFFRSNFKVEWENGVWTKIRLLASDFLFTCGNFTFVFTVSSIFRIGFSYWFPESVHSSFQV